MKSVLARSSLIAMAMLCAGLVAVPVSAHHSVAMFEDTTEIVLTGTVRALEWANPHVWIRLNVADAQGNVVEWGIEASNPLDLGRKGWSRTTFKPDDNVTITIHPAKNGQSFGSFIRAIMPDGSLLGEPEGEEKASGKN